MHVVSLRRPLGRGVFALCKLCGAALSSVALSRAILHFPLSLFPSNRALSPLSVATRSV